MDYASRWTTDDELEYVQQMSPRLLRKYLEFCSVWRANWGEIEKEKVLVSVRERMEECGILDDTGNSRSLTAGR